MAKHSAIFVSGTTLPIASASHEGMVKAGTGLSVDVNGVMSVINALTNPMTSPGDIIVGGSAGAPQRLPKGSNGQVLTMVAGVPTYATPASQLPTSTAPAGFRRYICVQSGEFARPGGSNSVPSS